MKGKCIIVSAPSGAGKTTIVRHLLEAGLGLEFSVSACSRKPRPGETNGVDYYFFSEKTFKDKIENNEFLEWQEVYNGNFYGTLKSELTRIWNKGNYVIFDVDVLGGINLKKIFGEQALSIFILPPSPEVLEARLRGRSSDPEDSLQQRIARARFELEQQEAFDLVIVNDTLEEAQQQAVAAVRSFLFGNT
ncbi:MAG TPA: guanylate kinase [Bacteroidales bacterium]|nr:guanylate kinase [Bacteroidales bacterium]HSA43022.1 guanylate kinase [Bacteroidales bacterium]